MSVRGTWCYLFFLLVLSQADLFCELKHTLGFVNLWMNEPSISVQEETGYFTELRFKEYFVDFALKSIFLRDWWIVLTKADGRRDRGA